MGVKTMGGEAVNSEEEDDDASERAPLLDKCIVLHPLADLSSAYPSVFVYQLKQIFIHGSGKSTEKFHAIRKQFIQALPTAPLPGPATFAIRCLEALTRIDAPYNEGLGHIFTSSINRISMGERGAQDSSGARQLATSLFVSALRGAANVEDRIAVKIVEVFDVGLSNVNHVLSLEHGDSEVHGEAFIEPLVLRLINGGSFNCAASLTRHFCLDKYSAPDFLATMVSAGQHQLAGRWAWHLGKDVLCSLVQCCMDRGAGVAAYAYVQKYQLRKIFPNARYLYRCSTLPSLALCSKPGSTSIEDPLLEAEKQGMEGLGFQGDKPLHIEASKDGKIQFLQLSDISSVDKIVWVDSLKELLFATRHFSGRVSMVGIDCEWKANRTKESQLNKVAILQIATSDFVFVFDMINLFQQHRDELNTCVKLVFRSKKILKLGYAVYNDLERLLESYLDLDCFHVCESVLDLHLIAGKGIKGGLSGLTKAVLGSYIDKHVRMSDWEQRPLSTKQLHYAALDAAVLLSIFDRVNPTQDAMRSTFDKLGWRRHADWGKVETRYLDLEGNCQRQSAVLDCD